MQIELNSSNRNEWPLGTGRSTVHVAGLTCMWCRSAHGPKGTAQGNRGSATQGGVRQLDGFLPFQTSSDLAQRLARAGVLSGSMNGAACLAVSGIVMSSSLSIRELPMSLTHFVPGCAIVALTALALVVMTGVAKSLAWSRPGTA
jgi:hypothetical protein